MDRGNFANYNFNWINRQEDKKRKYVPEEGLLQSAQKRKKSPIYFTQEQAKRPQKSIFKAVQNANGNVLINETNIDPNPKSLLPSYDSPYISDKENLSVENLESSLTVHNDGGLSPKQTFDMNKTGSDISIQSEAPANHETLKTFNSINYTSNSSSVKFHNLKSFFRFDNFNSIQTQCVSTLLYTNDNMIISSPTGSGKTVLFELAFIRILQFRAKYNQLNIKAVYISPIKALCQEKQREWSDKFREQEFANVVELTGDTDQESQDSFLDATLIITTPEKWDAITRKWRDHFSLVAQIALLMIDEVHLLNTEERGATLEAVVSRMKILSKNPEVKNFPCSSMRIIAVSATIPNINDIAEWLDVKKENVKIFGDEHRAVKLEKHVLGYNMAKNEFQFEQNLNYRLLEVIRKFSEGRPSLVFCQTQRGTITACEILTQKLNPRELISDDCKLKQLYEAAAQVSDKNLQKYIPQGLAFHNGGLSCEDRRIVESLFISNHILILSTTSTLAQGVNLPARLIVIKSTMTYRGTSQGYQEYSQMEIDQMMGRAGRPQYDTRGVVVIMTETKNVEKYRNMSSSKEALESHLAQQIPEHLNAEISLRTICSLETAEEYLKSTFFFIRLRKSQTGLFEAGSKTTIDEYIKILSQKTLETLSKYELISLDQINKRVRPLDLGMDISRFYVAFEIIKRLFDYFDEKGRRNGIQCDAKQIKANKKIGLLASTLEEVMLILSESQEFDRYRSKLDERKKLNSLNEQIRFGIKGAISSPAKKVFVLIQCIIGNVAIDDWELKRSYLEIKSICWRILMCFKRFFLIKKMADYLSETIKLIKFIKNTTWEEDQLGILRQLPGVGEKMASNLIQANIISLENILETSPSAIDRACGKHGPFGSNLIKYVERIPKFRIELPRSGIIKLVEETKDRSCIDGYNSNVYVIIKDASEKLVLHKYLRIEGGGLMSYNDEISVNVGKATNFPLKVSLLNEIFVGADYHIYIGKGWGRESDANNIASVDNYKHRPGKVQENAKLKAQAVTLQEMNVPNAGVDDDEFDIQLIDSTLNTLREAKSEKIPVRPEIKIDKKLEARGSEIRTLALPTKKVEIQPIILETRREVAPAEGTKTLISNFFRVKAKVVNADKEGCIGGKKSQYSSLFDNLFD